MVTTLKAKWQDPLEYSLRHTAHIEATTLVKYLMPRHLSRTQQPLSSETGLRQFGCEVRPGPCSLLKAPSCEGPLHERVLHEQIMDSGVSEGAVRVEPKGMKALDIVQREQQESIPFCSHNEPTIHRHHGPAWCYQTFVSTPQRKMSNVLCTKQRQPFDGCEMEVVNQ